MIQSLVLDQRVRLTTCLLQSRHQQRLLVTVDGNITMLDPLSSPLSNTQVIHPLTSSSAGFTISNQPNSSALAVSYNCPIYSNDISSINWLCFHGLLICHQIVDVQLPSCIPLALWEIFSFHQHITGLCHLM